MVLYVLQEPNKITLVFACRVDLTDNNGNTALRLASYNNHYKTVQYLREQTQRQLLQALSVDVIEALFQV